MLSKKNGSVLMICLWILTILVIFAVSLASRAGVSLKLARYQKDTLRVKLFSVSGINKTLALLNSQASLAKAYDTIEECGFDPQAKIPKDLFGQNFGDTKNGFIVGYKNSNGNFVYGPSDEEGRININISSAPGNDFEKNKIATLFEEYKIGDAADTVSLAEDILSWRDSSNTSINLAKKENFTYPEELLLVLEYFYIKEKGNASQEAIEKARRDYNALKDNITIYGDGVVNINTAPRQVIRVMIIASAKSLSPAPEDLPVYLSAAENVFTKISALLDQGPLKDQSQLVVDMTSASAEEKNIFNDIKDRFKVVSGFFRINSQGSASNLSKLTTVVYDRKNKKIVYWQQN